MKRYFALALLVALTACRKDPDPEPGPAPLPVPPGNITVLKDTSTGKEYWTGLLHEDPATKKFGKVYMKFAEGECDNLPEEFDLRDPAINTVPPVRDQGSCGSCWAFSQTASLESANMLAGKKLDLSEQEIVSCDKQNYGCGGGMLNGFKYQIDHGQGLESDFPYRASDVRCKSIPVASKGISFAYIGSPDNGPTEKELKCALYKYHTIPWITLQAFMNASHDDKTPFTSCSHGQTDHAVGTVGWYTKNGNTYFKLRNSWGTDWGAAGYSSLKLGCNNFGSEEVAFIQVQQPAPPPPPPPPTPPVPPPPPPTPDPCQPPKIALPAVVMARPGVEVMLGVKPQAAWTFEWFNGAQSLGTDSMIYVTPTQDTIYKLTAKSSCGQAEASVKVTLLVTAAQQVK